MKDSRTLLCGSPLVLLQMSTMCFFVISATLEALTQFTQIGAGIYSIVLSTIFILTIYSLIKTFTTHPGEVNQTMIDRLKS